MMNRQLAIHEETPINPMAYGCFFIFMFSKHLGFNIFLAIVKLLFFGMIFTHKKAKKMLFPYVSSIYDSKPVLLHRFF